MKSCQKIPFSLASLLMGSLSLAGEARVQDASPDAVTKHLIQQVLKINKQQAACSASPTPSPSPAPQPQVTNVETVEYVCTSSTPDPKDSKVQPERFLLEISHVNDNHLLGLLKSGDDKGMTSGFDLKGTFKVKSDLEFTALLQSELYTKALSSDDFLQVTIPGSTILNQVIDPVTGQLISESFRQNQSVVLQPSPDGPEVGKGEPVRLIDVARFLAQLKKGKDLYFLVDLGVESRKRTPWLGAGIQDPWHKLINANQYNYLSPEGGVGGIVEYQETGRQNPGEGLNTSGNIHDFTLTTYRWEGSRLGKEVLKRPIASWAGLLGIGAGIEKTLLQAPCKCELVAKARSKLNLVIEKNGLGENSRLENEVVLKMKVKRISLTGAFEMEYFFVKDESQPGSEQETSPGNQVGKGASIELSLAPSAKSKGKVFVTPFMKLGKKDGRLMFEQFNDPDSLMTLGFRIGFR